MGMKPKQPTTYELYLADPRPETLRAVVDEHRDFINGTVNRMVGKVSPVVQTRSYLLAADAIKKYDPTKKVPLKHWIAQGLQPVHRVAKKVTEVISVPEALRREAAQLAKARDELREKLYRDPSPDELADHTGIPVRKQTRISKGLFWTQSEGQVAQSLEAGGDEAEELSPVAFKRNDVEEIQDYVYHDLGDIDKIIFRHRLGYGGAEKLQNIAIAKLVNLTPAAVTQRANRLQRQLEEAYQWR